MNEGELLPDLEGKIHMADYDAVKEVIEKASDPSYAFRTRFLTRTVNYLERLAREQELYKNNPESRNLVRKAVDIIREL